MPIHSMSVLEIDASYCKFCNLLSSNFSTRNWFEFHPCPFLSVQSSKICMDSLTGIKVSRTQDYPLIIQHKGIMQLINLWSVLEPSSNYRLSQYLYLPGCSKTSFRVDQWDSSLSWIHHCLDTFTRSHKIYESGSLWIENLSGIYLMS